MAAKIRVMSDLHLEFGGDGVHFSAAPEEILVLAGDTLPAIHQRTYRSFITTLAEEFKHVVFCAGNHEFYGGQVVRETKFLVDLAAEFDNVHFLEGSHVNIDGVLFIGGALWTNLSAERVTSSDIYLIQQRMNDFRLVEFDDNRSFDANLATFIHMEHLHNIEESLKLAAASSLPAVVISHHAPSEKSILPMYHKDVCNPAYATNLEHIMEEYKPKLWVHGHMHNSLDYVVHDTRVVCNPLGYYGYKLNPDFNFNFEIEIDAT